MTRVVLPWPTGPLWPNRNAHWHVLYRHRKAAHKAAWLLCMAAGVERGPGHLAVTLHPPRKPGLMNIDGCISALKASVDGIAQAMAVDDSELRIAWPLAFAEPVKGGAVVVEIQPI